MWNEMPTLRACDCVSVESALSLLDPSRSLQPHLAFRPDINELVYSFDRGTPNIKWLGGTDEQKSEQEGRDIKRNLRFGVIGKVKSQMNKRTNCSGGASLNGHLTRNEA